MTRILVVCMAGVALTAVPGLCQTNRGSLTCFGTKPGETAPEIARRLTGSTSNVDELWFQIYDPASNRFLPKAEYGALQPGWRACLLAARIDSAELPRQVAPAHATYDSWIRRVTAMTGFGHRFVGEFERPLRRAGSTTLPVDSRLRPQPARRRLDILLAPHVGRSYPNLADHRTNVEYDVGRVMKQLGDDRFVAERLFTNGRWVVVRCSVRMDLADGGET